MGLVRKMLSKMLALWLLLAALVAVAGADEASEEVEEAASDDGEIGASEHVKTVTLFPEYPDQKFTQGQLIDVLCGFSNTGDKSFNVTKLEGSLHSTMDYRYIQNFTERTPSTEIKEGGQGTLLFQFYSDPNLEPRDYVLTLSVDYVTLSAKNTRLSTSIRRSSLSSRRPPRTLPSSSAMCCRSSCWRRPPLVRRCCTSGSRERRARRPRLPWRGRQVAPTSGSRIPCSQARRAAKRPKQACKAWWPSCGIDTSCHMCYAHILRDVRSVAFELFVKANCGGVEWLLSSCRLP